MGNTYDMRAVPSYGEGLVAEVGDLWEGRVVLGVEDGDLEVPELVDDDQVGQRVEQPHAEGEERKQQRRRVGVRDKETENSGVNSEL